MVANTANLIRDWLLRKAEPCDMLGVVTNYHEPGFVLLFFRSLTRKKHCGLLLKVERHEAVHLAGSVLQFLAVTGDLNCQPPEIIKASMIRERPDPWARPCAVVGVITSPDEPSFVGFRLRSRRRKGRGEFTLKVERDEAKGLANSILQFLELTDDLKRQLSKSSDSCASALAVDGQGIEPPSSAASAACALRSVPSTCDSSSTAQRPSPSGRIKTPPAEQP